MALAGSLGQPDTIFALASGGGRAGIAVIRVSGPLSGRALEALGGRALPPPRRATRLRLRNGGGEVLDDCLALWFPGPHSFTGEDVAEFHLHGGRAVVAGVSEALVELGLRPAEAGEFSRRAFDNGKLDLTAAEAIADLVAAETAAQRRQALRQMEGELARLYDGWRERLMRGLAHLEAIIDFPEEDLPPALMEGVKGEIRALAAEIDRHLVGAKRGERLREGVEVAIVGAPNVGKSSLLNRLARREAAIVSATAGTTRDVVEVRLDLGGYPVTVADTAGLREAVDEIENEGIRRARARAESADMVVAVFDATALPELDGATRAMVAEGAVVVFNKSDLAREAVPPVIAGCPSLAVSAATGEGLEALVDLLQGRVAALAAGGGEVVPTRLRHRVALEACRQDLDRALAATEIELVAEDLRMAARALGRITGRVDVEDLLDVIFRDFCIGK